MTTTAHICDTSFNNTVVHLIVPHCSPRRARWWTGPPHSLFPVDTHNPAAAESETVIKDSSVAFGALSFLLPRSIEYEKNLLRGELVWSNRMVISCCWFLGYRCLYSGSMLTNEQTVISLLRKRGLTTDINYVLVTHYKYLAETVYCQHVQQGWAII